MAEIQQVVLSNLHDLPEIEEECLGVRSRPSLSQDQNRMKTVAQKIKPKLLKSTTNEGGFSSELKTEKRDENVIKTPFQRTKDGCHECI